MPAEPAQAREAVHNLIRAGLVTINPASTTRTVQVHPMVQALTRAVLGEAELRQAVRSAADALVQSWPVQQVPQRLAQALRDSAGRLREVSGDALWVPEAHPVLLRAGQSLGHGPLTGVAILYWEGLLDSADRVLGPAQPAYLPLPGRPGLGVRGRGPDGRGGHRARADPGAAPGTARPRPP